MSAVVDFPTPTLFAQSASHIMASVNTANDELILLVCDRLDRMTLRLVDAFGLGMECGDWSSRFALSAEVAIESAREEKRHDLLVWRGDILEAMLRNNLATDPYHVLDERFTEAVNLATRIDHLHHRFSNYAAGLISYMRPAEAARLQDVLPLVEESQAFIEEQASQMRRTMRDAGSCLKMLLSIDGLDSCCERLAERTAGSYAAIFHMADPHFTTLASMAAARQDVLNWLASGARVSEGAGGVADQYVSPDYILGQEPAVRNAIVSLGNVVTEVETLRSTIPGDDDRRFSLQDVDNAFRSLKEISSVAATISNVGEPLENILQYYVTKFTEIYHDVYG